jgi:DNA polymerase-3 subunit epsilon
MGSVAHRFREHKGRSIAEARTDAGLRRWLDGLAQSANARNARMGRWYLRSLEEASEPSLFVAWECARDPAAVAVAGRGLVLYVNPELQRLRALVDAARARLAELEAGFTIEKAKVEAMKARLFARLREHFQRRDRLRLVIGYRRKYLDSLVRQGEEEAGKIAQEYRQASAHSDREYAETAAALAEKQELTAEEAAEVSQLWRKLVKLFHPDRFAHEPEKQMGWGKFEIRISKSETNSKSVKTGKDERIRRLRLWHFHSFGFSPSEEREIAQLCRLWTRIELEIIRVLEAGNALKESPDYELHRLTAQTPAFFDEMVRQHLETLEEEVVALESEAEELARK